MMKSIRLLLTVAVGLILMAGCGFFGGGNQNAMIAGKSQGDAFKRPEKPKFKIPVTVEAVKRGRMYAYLQAVGSVVPIKEIEIKPEMSARIYFTRRWMEGDDIKKGDLYASMDDRDLNMDINEADLQLELAKAAVRPASAALTQAFKNEDFKRNMYERGAASKAEFDQAVLSRIQQENSYAQTLKNIDSRKMSLDKLKQQAEKISIVIPYEGVLLPAKQSVVNTQKETGESDLTLMQGQMVGTGTVLCRLANIEQVYVALDVPAKDLEQVQIGQKVELDIYSRTNKLYIGTVAEISTALNASTRTYTVNILVDNPDHELRPGMFAKARIITDEKPAAVKVPRELVLLRNGYNVLFVAVEKKAEEVQSATGEGPVIPPRNQDERKELAQDTQTKDHPETSEQKENSESTQQNQGGGMEKVAVADDRNPNADNDELENEPIEEVEEKPEVTMIAEQRIVTLGIQNREEVEIVDGLHEGDQLVVLGYDTLTDGVDINITSRDINSAIASSPAP